jgi:hypothetical protein
MVLLHFHLPADVPAVDYFAVNFFKTPWLVTTSQLYRKVIVAVYYDVNSKRIVLFRVWPRIMKRRD